LLNISPDHLDRHGDMQTYIDAKLKMFANHDESNFAVLCCDDQIILDNQDKIRSKKIWFGSDKKADVYIKDEWVYFFCEKVANVKGFQPKGRHNLANLLCAVCICKLLGVKNIHIQNAIDTFKPFDHRMQNIGCIGEVTFINDSKATNVGAVLPSLEASDNISLILGGSDKGYCFDQLFLQMPNTVKYCVFYGETQNKLAESAIRCGFYNYFFADTFEQSVKIAYHSIYPKGTVLLSPACASFDLFENYQERGDEFYKIFLELKNEK